MTTTYVDKHGVKHWGVMARMTAWFEGGKVTVS